MVVCEPREVSKVRPGAKAKVSPLTWKHISDQRHRKHELRIRCVAQPTSLVCSAALKRSHYTDGSSRSALSATLPYPTFQGSQRRPCRSHWGQTSTGMYIYPTSPHGSPFTAHLHGFSTPAQPQSRPASEDARECAAAPRENPKAWKFPAWTILGDGIWDDADGPGRRA